MSGKQCLHIPNTGCCIDEIKGRKCPVQKSGGACTGKVGGINANEGEAKIQITRHPENRKSKALGSVPLERRVGYRFHATSHAVPV